MRYCGALPPRSNFSMNTYSVEHKGRNVCLVRFTGVDAEWEQWILLSSDRHHDNKYSRWDLERRHLEQVKERNALILDVGDLFCAMQGKYDPRKSYDELRPEYATDAYFDAIVKDAVKFYGPYAEHFLVIGQGNHEATVLSRNGTDLIGNFVYGLNSQYGVKVQRGGFGGWIRFMFVAHKTKRSSLNLKYFHGAGGGGPVTRGVIQTNRQAVIYRNADIVVNGHTHDSWHVPIAQEMLSQAGVVRKVLQHHIRTATYKDDYRDGYDGWHVGRGGPPKPLGAVWLRFHMVWRDDMYHVDTEVVLANE
jgi:hypothetical protein